MAAELYPHRGAPTDPLRLAEEYRTALGRPALEALIYNLVRDPEWLPGRLHHALVSLPWSDILTTNWDTLLERAAPTNVQQTYEVVRTLADIPRTRAPRIVKLHGSMPSNRPFIFTEEDYRTYPRLFAPFVNLVQQVLLENELCLLGFFGDDPNFLQWSGWVRDQLGAAARRVYLIGPLDLSPARRKFLESRNVSPVDLGPLLTAIDPSDRHREASQLFLEFLARSKPRPLWDWPSETSRSVVRQIGAPAATDALMQERIATLEKEWHDQRAAYPGWLLCPATTRNLMRLELGSAERAMGGALDHLPETSSRSLLREAAWRFNVCLLPLPDWLKTALSRALESDKSQFDKKTRCELALLLIRAAREARDYTTLEHWVAYAQREGAGDIDTLAATVYEQALYARDDLNLSLLEQLVPRISGPDPIWSVRRAGLLFDLGERDEAVSSLQSALKAVRERQERNRRSLWVISRLAWTTYFARATTYFARATVPVVTEPSQSSSKPTEHEPWPEEFHVSKCDPWDELYALDSERNDAFRRRSEHAEPERPRFDAGTYTRTISFGRSTEISINDVLRVAAITGIPLEADNVNLFRSRLAESLELLDSYDEGDLLLCIRACGSSSDRLLEAIFGRIQVARLPMDTVEHLIVRLSTAIDFGIARLPLATGNRESARRAHWIERLRVYLEVLSRLVMRLAPDKATTVFRKAANLAHDPRWNHWWLFQPLGNLLQRSLEAVPPTDRHAVLLDFVNLPLPDERGLRSGDPSTGDWPEPKISFPKPSPRPTDPAFNTRIVELIRKVQEGDAVTRQRATIRLFSLFQWGMLDNAEGSAFGEAIWSRRPSADEFPSDTGLYQHAFFDLPGASQDVVARILRTGILNKSLTEPLAADRLIALTGAARLQNDGSRRFAPTADEAQRLYDRLIAWRPRNAPFDLDSYDDEMRDAVGPVLAQAALPFVEAICFGTPRIEATFAFAASVPSALVALPAVLRLNTSYEERILEILHASLSHGDRTIVVGGLRAVGYWFQQAKWNVLPKTPKSLVEAVLALAWSRRTPSLVSALRLCVDFAQGAVLDDDHKRLLARALAALREETAYERWNILDPGTVSWTLVRAACVRLSGMLIKTGFRDPAVTVWMAEAKADPVPEVRYAIDFPDE